MIELEEALVDHAALNSDSYILTWQHNLRFS